ncbi:unnamed protein product [Nyctereutes procyonoides]|uniref:(raccoon dog) hypothetical protein n=1 Tax=Nyctereutes procyonoides TaxID=34880 RepID=A0A811YYC8_NYCPR|nr:unnamed protein product [Nyctereutes procyonoides]
MDKVISKGVLIVLMFYDKSDHILINDELIKWDWPQTKRNSKKRTRPAGAAWSRAPAWLLLPLRGALDSWPTPAASDSLALYAHYAIPGLLGATVLLPLFRTRLLEGDAPPSPPRNSTLTCKESSSDVPSVVLDPLLLCKRVPFCPHPIQHLWFPALLIFPILQCELVQPLWKTVWRFLKELKIDLPYDPAIALNSQTLSFWVFMAASLYRCESLASGC